MRRREARSRRQPLMAHENDDHDWYSLMQESRPAVLVTRSNAVRAAELIERLDAVDREWADMPMPARLLRPRKDH